MAAWLMPRKFENAKENDPELEEHALELIKKLYMFTTGSLI